MRILTRCGVASREENMFKLTPTLLFVLALPACSLPATSFPATRATTSPVVSASREAISTDTPIPTSTTSVPVDTATGEATLTPTNTSIPTTASLKATVTAERLSCRYGPGPEYLYLYGLRAGANITLVGWTGGSNWVWVEGKNPCWLNAKFVDIQGDFHALPVTYPNPARLPKSPYYQPTTVLNVERNKDEVTVEWLDIPLRAGDEEDESMLHYIVETWRCENGQLVFDPLATNDTTMTYIDQKGCSQPSHGRIFVQEKHGFAGPTEIPWPEHRE